jgi:RimJ/RimL family protein N-acetyltransferase
MTWLEPVTLSGLRVRLELLDHRHESDLIEAVKDGELWRLWYTTIAAPENMGADIDRRLRLHEAGTMLPFAVIEAASAKAVGMTTYVNVDAVNKRLEIGATWYRRSVQRTDINTQCKLLLLTHAFEALD